MKAIRIHQTGSPEVLRREDVPDPTPGPGEALVKIAAAGVNFIDVYFRTGLYPYPIPGILGLEAAGTVIALGAGVDDVQVGDRVAYTTVPGAYAEMSVVPADRLVKLPEGVSFREGAAAMLQGMTAHYLATSTYALRPGDVCLIHAAAGGVGVSTFAKGLDCLRTRGMMVLFGQASGPVPPFDLSLLNPKGSLYVTRPSLQAYTATREELLTRACDVLGWIAAKKLRLHIEHEFPLRDAAEAHRALEGRRTTGKVLLIP